MSDDILDRIDAVVREAEELASETPLKSWIEANTEIRLRPWQAQLVYAVLDEPYRAW